MEEEVKPDVLVRIYPPSRNEDPLLALPLRSQVLCARSSFFAARLSQRWQSPAHTTTSKNKPKDGESDAELFAIDIVVHHSSAASTYKRCIDLMYVRRKDMMLYHPFSGVDDALCMLRIATELLFQDCMDACTEFLDMKCSWTVEEEVMIRSTLSFLQLAHIHPDLARRLSLPKSMPMNEPTLIFRRMLVCALQASTPSLKALDPAKPISESSILVAWNTHLDIIRKWVTEKMAPPFYGRPKVSVEDADVAVAKLVWLFDRLLALRAADAVVKASADDTGLSSALQVFLNRGWSSFSVEGQFGRRMCSLLARMLQSVVKGEVLLSQAARLALTKTWLPICDTSPGRDLVSSFMSLVNSLPVVDREQFYMQYCMGPNIHEQKLVTQQLSLTFWPWCDTLREVETHLSGGCGVVVVSDDHAC